MISLSSAVLLLCLLSSSRADSDEVAQIIGIKRIINNFVVKGKDITVQYDIYNNGKQPALNVELRDNTFPSDYFTVKEGLQSARWPSIQAGTNVSHVVILTAQQTVMFNISQATIRYKAGPDARGFSFSETSGQGEIIVYGDEVYEKQFSAHPTEWLSFALMTVPSLLIPLALWYRSSNKYAQLMARGGRKAD